MVYLGTGTGEEEQQGGQPRRQDAARDHLSPQDVHTHHDVDGWYLQLQVSGRRISANYCTIDA